MSISLHCSMSWVLSVPNTISSAMPGIIQDTSEDTQFIAAHGFPVHLYYRRIFIISLCLSGRACVRGAVSPLFFILRRMSSIRLGNDISAASIFQVRIASNTFSLSFWHICIIVHLCFGI